MTELNPHQFGDQLTLFDAPLGQPGSGTFKGNPAARLFRTVHVPVNTLEGLRRSRWGEDIGGSSEEATQDVIDYASRKRSDRGHTMSLGIHWQHDLLTAQDHLGHTGQASMFGRHGDKGVPVILESDHPGTEHVIDDTPNMTDGQPGGRPEGVSHNPSGNNRLTGFKKDWSLINDTVGPHSLKDNMLAEVPVRPGAPMQIHAVHFPDPEDHNNWIRNPVQFKGQA